MKNESALAGRWARRLKAALCAGSLALLAACGGSGGGSLERFQPTTYQGEPAIRDNVTGIVWAASLGTSTGRVPAAHELLTLADVPADQLSPRFGFVLNRYVQAAEPVPGSTTDAVVVDFGQQRAGGVSDEAIDPAAPFAQWRVLWPAASSQAPLDNAYNGTVVRDRLMWSMCTVGASYNAVSGTCSTGAPAARTLAQAQADATASRLAGFDDWRLPTKAELQGLLRLESTQRALLAEPFRTADAFDPAGPLPYWTASNVSTIAGSAWIVDFSLVSDFGGVELIDQTNSLAWVRLVRTFR